ncbi:MAG: glycosyltransferase family 4 protein [Chloroflexota bacterium]
MKVGLVIYGDISTLSGGYLYDRKLVEYLRNQGDEVEIISLPWRDYLSHCRDNFNRKLLKRLKYLKVDVLLQDELNHPSFFLLNGTLKKFVQYPLVSIVHHLRCSEKHPSLLRWVYRHIERHYLNTVDGFICNSQTTLQTVKELLTHPKPALIATPGGDALSGKPVPNLYAHRYNSQIQLLFVGNWIPRKGLHILLEALAPLDAFPWRLSLVGRTNLIPSYERKIRHQITTKSLHHRVHIHGAVSDEELVRLWQSADVLVVPSEYEGFGIVYLEAMRFGVIPIGGTNGAAAEIIQSGINGFLVQTNSPVELRDILKVIMIDPGLRESLKKAARQRYEQFPTWQQSMRCVRQFLMEYFVG